MAKNLQRNRRICEMRGLKSASLIAEELGISRNAVIGVWNRAGLSSSNGVKPAQRKKRTDRPGRPKTPTCVRQWVLADANQAGAASAARKWGLSQTTICRWKREA